MSMREPILSPGEGFHGGMPGFVPLCAALCDAAGRHFAGGVSVRGGKRAALRFLDPACGCGNFLIIAYRELRTLELEVLKSLHPDRRQRGLDVAVLSRVNVDRFHGIEIGEFLSRISEVALWMMDRIMNIRLSLEFGEVYARIPLTTPPHIHCADALETDWTAVLPPTECDYRYSSGIVYNAFPWPQADAAAQARVRRLAQDMLDARARFPDAVVDRLYGAGMFANDRARVDCLFGLYESLFDHQVSS